MSKSNLSIEDMVTIDIRKTAQENIPTSNIKQYNDLHVIHFNITKDGKPLDLSDKTVRIYGEKADGTTIFNNLVITDAKEGQVDYEITDNALAVNGLLKLELSIYEGKNVVATKILLIKVNKTLRNDDAIESTNEFGAFVTEIDRLDKKIDGMIIGSSPVQSVNGKIGKVELKADDIPFEDGNTFQDKLDKGELKGHDGKQGDEGYSPKVSIIDGSGIHTINIQDKESTKTTIIKDGNDGLDGKKVVIAKTSKERNYKLEEWLEYTNNAFEIWSEIDNCKDLKKGDILIIKGTVEGKYPCFVYGEIRRVIYNITQEHSDIELINMGLITSGQNGKDGTNGLDGKDGVEGFSPTVTTQDSEGQHTIIITDKKGSHKVIVKDGQNGKNGANGNDGAKGEDAKINGYNTLNIVPGANIDIQQHGTTMTISGKSSGEGGGSVDSVNGKTGVVILGANDINFEDGESFQDKLDNGSLKGQDGKDGQNGSKGDRGENGFSPIVEVSSSGKTHTVNITDSNGLKTFTVKDGLDGKNGDKGYSPKVNITGVEGGSKVTITDEDGAYSTTIKNGLNGKDGLNGNDGFSPIVTIQEGDKQRTLKIQDKENTKTTIIKDGNDGQNGSKGDDGFSPKVTVREGVGSHTVDIQDKDSTKTFTVKDGSDGKDGLNGEKGEDAKINGQNTLEIVEGDNITISQVGSRMTISAAASGGVSKSYLQEHYYDKASTEEAIDKKVGNKLTPVNVSSTSLTLAKDKNQILLSVPQNFELKLPTPQPTESLEIHLFMTVEGTAPTIIFPSVLWQNKKSPDIKQNTTYELIFSSISNDRDVMWLGGAIEYGNQALNE